MVAQAIEDFLDDDAVYVRATSINSDYLDFGAEISRMSEIEIQRFQSAQKRLRALLVELVSYTLMPLHSMLFPDSQTASQHHFLIRSTLTMLSSVAALCLEQPQLGAKSEE